MMDEIVLFGKKYLVFESNLFEFFQSCYKCFVLVMFRFEKVVGLMIVIVFKCLNGYMRIWMS